MFIAELRSVKHEPFMGMRTHGLHAVFHGEMAIGNWVNVYDGDLGIALSDTYTSAIFLSNLSRKQAKLFDGVRCDSGDEFRFIERKAPSGSEFREK